MKFDKKSLLLYAVTDRAWTQNESLYSQVEKALKGGVTFLQIREKNLPKQEFKTEAEELKTDEIAQIQNIISREMGAKVENIHIMKK